MNEIHEQAQRLRYDLTALQAKVSELLRMTATLPDNRDQSVCPVCRLPLPGPRTLAEHQYQQHEGDVPAHWLEAEQRSSV